MSVTDPISDMFTRIRNALLERHEKLSMPYSNEKYEIAKLLVSEGFIRSVDVDESDPVKRQLKVQMKYSEDGACPIKVIERVSRPGRRVYIQKSRIPKVQYGFGISIISTSKGMLTGRDARINNVGGEYVGKVY